VVQHEFEDLFKAPKLITTKTKARQYHTTEGWSHTPNMRPYRYTLIMRAKITPFNDKNAKAIFQNLYLL
jgi:hypothetical protein